jgi:hypothetical protein
MGGGGLGAGQGRPLEARHASSRRARLTAQTGARLGTPAAHANTNPCPRGCRYLAAAMKFREQLRDRSSRPKSGGGSAAAAGSAAAKNAAKNSLARARAGDPGEWLEALVHQIEEGDLDLSTMEALVDQMMTLGGMMRLVKAHSTHVRQVSRPPRARAGPAPASGMRRPHAHTPAFPPPPPPRPHPNPTPRPYPNPSPTTPQYALLGQNLLDDVAATAEALYAMASGQDLVACLWFYGFCLTCFAFCCVFGIGWGVFVSICYLVRPPILRGVPGVWGFRAFFHNLPARSAEDFV